MRRRQESGFTAVELLITLFVAAAFLISGYQLFNIVIQDGGETRAESRAGNLAYDYLRQYSDVATNPCTAQTPLTEEPVVVDGLVDVTISVVVSCPQTDTPSLSKVEAVISYNSPQKTLSYATFVDKSKGASLENEVTNGLVAWWKLNGNPTSSVGSFDGVVYGARLAASPLGEDMAYEFTTGTDHISIPYSAAYRPTSAMTVSAWVRPDTLTTTARQKIVSMIENGSYGLIINGSVADATCSANMLCFMVYIGGSYRTAQVARTSLAVGQWRQVVGVYSGSAVTLYVNGSPVATTAITGPIGHSTAPLCIGAEPNASACISDFFDGRIDDVRIYNRALSPAEITQLFTGGGK